MRMTRLENPNSSRRSSAAQPLALAGVPVGSPRKLGSGRIGNNFNICLRSWETDVSGFVDNRIPAELFMYDIILLGEIKHKLKAAVYILHSTSKNLDL